MQVFISGELIINKLQGEELISTQTIKNLVVNGGRSAMASFIASPVVVDKNITKIQFGTNGTDSALTDIDITSPFEVTLGTPTISANFVEFPWTLLESASNGVSILEFGLICEDGTLFSRIARAEAIQKNNTFRLEGIWKISF